MADVNKGYTFGTTEQVTAAKLHSLVDSATIGNIVNADVAVGAAIQDSKLAEINTANKVNGSALMSLANTPSGAGVIPVANIDVGTSASKIVQLTAAAKLPAVDGSLVTGVVAASMDPANLSSAVAINKGGTGQVTAQAAIDALTAVSSATNEHVFTKDTTTGNAKFKAIPAQDQNFKYIGTTTITNATSSGSISISANKDYIAIISLFSSNPCQFTVDSMNFGNSSQSGIGATFYLTRMGTLGYFARYAIGCTWGGEFISVARQSSTSSFEVTSTQNASGAVKLYEIV